jgi:hypothetical protein
MAVRVVVVAAGLVVERQDSSADKYLSNIHSQ